ncbi:MAG: hypothetical protein JXB26_17840 [Candidatus Aminicenantes bacterium]|nr:hypothetical protein [Candidatus Aminicenantes bacterium]
MNNLDWGWIFEKTIQFTIHSLVRLKDKMVAFVSDHPAAAAVIFTAIIILVFVFIYAREKSRRFRS